MSEENLRKCVAMGKLREHYSPAVATEINKYVTDFMPYLSNFGTIYSSFFMKDNQKLLVLQCPLFVAPHQSGGTGARGGDDELPPLFINVLFPQMFPSVPPFCSIWMDNYQHNNISKWVVRQPSEAVSPNGAIRLAALSLLSGATPPYSLLEILVALTEQFELEFPLVPEKNNARDNASTSVIPLNPSSTMANEERTALERRAAEALMLHLLSKAEAYLDTREQSLHQIAQLYECAGTMREAWGLLEEKKAELIKYSPSVDKMESIIRAFTRLNDCMEAHSTLIVPTDEIQSHALELLSEIHALDDSLELLERSLRAGQISCKEYVRYVSDVGRKQFEARFLFARVAEAVNCVRDKAGRRLPTTPPRATSNPRPADGPIRVPAKLSNAELLNKEFPEVGSEMVNAVLNAVDGNIADARVQIKAMLS